MPDEQTGIPYTSRELRLVARRSLDVYERELMTWAADEIDRLAALADLREYVTRRLREIILMGGDSLPVFTYARASEKLLEEIERNFPAVLEAKMKGER